MSGLTEGIELLINKKKSIGSGSVQNISVVSDSIQDYQEFGVQDNEEIEINEMNDDNVIQDNNSQYNKKYSDSENSSQIYKPFLPPQQVSEEEILNKKRDFLYKFDRLEKKGIRLPKKFSLSSNLDEMEQEYERIIRDKEVDSMVKFQRRFLMTVVNGIELLNDKFDPIGAKLTGWSDKVYEDLDDYDEIFEELYLKYKNRGSMPPEVRLLFSLTGSAFMFHLSNSYSSQMPGLAEILKNNPGLAQNLASATMNHISEQKDTAKNLFGDAFKVDRPQMKEPTSMHAILEKVNNDELSDIISDVNTTSDINESIISQLIEEKTPSESTVKSKRNRTKKARKTLNILT